MKKAGLLVMWTILSISLIHSQTNTFPASGFVGIGINQPLNDLHIERALDGELSLLMKNPYGIGTRTFLTSMPDRSLIQTDRDFGINTNGGGWSEKFTLKNNGFIGIGETMPSSKLTIQNAGEGSSLSVQSTYNGYKKIFEITQESSDGFLYLRTANGDNVTKLSGYAGTPSYFLSNVGIGTISPAYKLDVLGTIRAREIIVDLNGADFVFEKDYKLMPLNELEKFVKEQKHLPEIAPAKEMEKNGTDLGNLNSKLLQKMEEMTLYIIEQNKAIDELKLALRLQR